MWTRQTHWIVSQERRQHTDTNTIGVSTETLGGDTPATVSGKRRLFSSVVRQTLLFSRRWVDWSLSVTVSHCRSLSVTVRHCQSPSVTVGTCQSLSTTVSLFRSVSLTVYLHTSSPSLRLCHHPVCVCVYACLCVWSGTAGVSVGYPPVVSTAAVSGT